jgi:biopolymer transport protein ExbD
METYDTFISYSHARDRRIAAALQSVLQKFGQARFKTALRVFRDDTSLGAAPILWPPIEQALSQSRFFILLASPEAAISDWVNKEVAYWLEHKSRETLLIGLTFGDLRWDRTAGDFVWDKDTPLPPALKLAFPAEPKWVDLRPYRWADLRHYPMRRNSKFIAVSANFGATIGGIAKHELLHQQLDEDRRERRRMRLAVGALIVVALFAWWQWRDAARQRYLPQPSSIDFNLPSETSNPQPQPPGQPIVLSLTANLTLWIGDKQINRQSMKYELDVATNGDKNRTIYLRADRSVRYDDISYLLDSIRTAGYTKVSLVMQTREEK